MSEKENNEFAQSQHVEWINNGKKANKSFIMVNEMRSYISWNRKSTVCYGTSWITLATNYIENGTGNRWGSSFNSII